eukprot:gene3896-5326_t
MQHYYALLLLVGLFINKSQQQQHSTEESGTNAGRYYQQKQSQQLLEQALVELTIMYHGYDEDAGIILREIDNAIFFQGQVFLNYLQQDEESLRVSREMSTFFAATKNNLPSSLVVLNEKLEWVPGPKLHMESFSNSSASSSNPDSAPQCTEANFLDESAYFLFPWEAHNSFHSLNDNVFSLLSSIVLQHVTGSLQGPTKRVLYVFGKQSKAQAKESFMFKLLRVIFDGEVRPATKIFRG